MQFVKESIIRAGAEVVFAFHEAPDAFARLQPPWQKSEVIQLPSSLEVGTRVILKAKFGPIWQTIVAEHVAYEPGKMFADRMVEGPFPTWLHKHVVIPRGESECLLRDEIEYELPLGALGRTFGGWFARKNLEKLFDFRHEVTREACESQ